MNGSLIPTGWRCGGCKPAEGSTLQVWDNGGKDGGKISSLAKEVTRKHFSAHRPCRSFSAQVLMPYLDCKCPRTAKGPCWGRRQAAFVIPVHPYEEAAILWFSFRDWES